MKFLITILLLIVTQVTYSKVNLSKLQINRNAENINGEISTDFVLQPGVDVDIKIANDSPLIATDVKVITPAGDIITEQNASDFGVTYRYHSPENDYEKLESPIDTLIINLPGAAGGTYSIRANTSAESIPITIQSLNSSISYYAAVGERSKSIKVGDYTPIALYLFDGYSPVTNASVNIKVYKDDVLLSDQNIKDDGQASDFKASDGIYFGVFKPQEAGNYQVIIKFEGIDLKGSEFEGELFTPFSAQMSELGVSTAFIEETLDHNSNGFFDELQLTFPFSGTFPSSGSIEVYSKISLNDGFVLADFRAIDVTENKVYAKFNGKEIRESGYSGSIKVDQLIVKHDDFVIINSSGLGETSYYENAIWERENLVYKGNFQESVEDNDQNGFYENITISFDVDTLLAGNYGYSVVAYTNSGEKAGVFGSESQELEVGNNTLQFNISDRAFSALGENTSLEIKELFIYPNFNADSSLELDYVGTTQSYDCWDFFGCKDGPNAPPVAVDDETRSDGSSIYVNVVSNDTDADGDILKLNSITQPSNGTVAIVGNSAEYTPNASFTGTDTFQYEIVDVHAVHKVLKGGSDTANVTVTVVRNNAPVANDDSYSVAKDIQTQLFVLENDTDADGDNLYITEVSSPTNGTVTNYGNSIVYEPSSNYEGQDTFTYTIVDVDKDTNIAKNGYDTATVLIEVGDIVNDPPVAADDSYAVKANTTEVFDVLANDYDPNGDPIYISQYSLPSQGVLEIIDNKIHYTSNSGATGSDSFAYEVSDTKGGKAIANVTISFIVENENSHPVANDDEITTLSGSAVTVDVLANDTDADGDTLNIDSFTNGSYGTVVQSGNNLVYTPESNYAGTDSFAYTISDGNGGSSTAVVTVIVEAANSQPTANDDYVSTLKDTAISIDVLANDTDSDNDTLLIANVTQGQNGSAEISGSNIVYSPNADFVGIDTFIYTISDGELTSEAIVEVTVLDENKAPVANDDIGDIYQGDSALFDVLNNDEDQNGDSLSVIAVSEPLPNHGSVSIQSNSIHYVAPTDFVGQVSVIYTISDGALTAESTLTINVNEKYQGPLISISSPEDGSNFYSGTAILFSSVLEVSNGDDLSNEVNWYSSIDGFLGNGVQIEREISSGEHEITVKVVDASGNEAADNIWIKVLPNTGNSYSSSVEHDIPDNKGYGVSSTINIEDNMTAMSIEIQADINHPELKDLAFQLVAPGGKHYNLENPGKYSANKIWKLDLNNPIEIKGAWTLKVSDQKKDNVGKILGWRITFE